MIDLLMRLEAAKQAFDAHGPMVRNIWIESVENGVALRRYSLPRCWHRSAAVANAERRVPCCGGKLRIVEAFHCAYPGMNGKLIESPVCQECPHVAIHLPQSEWPWWAKGIGLFGQADDMGIGDTVHRLIGDFASEQFSAWHQRIFGTPCRCPERRAEWNAEFSYKAPT